MVTVGPSPLIKPIGITAALLGIIQGAVWIILTFLGALIYLKAWEPDVLTQIPETYGQAVSFSVGEYLNSDLNDLKDQYITPKVLFGWLILYFVVSIIWIVISSIQMTAILQDQKGKNLKMVFIGWAIWTSIICLCDIILASLLAADYDDFVQHINEIGTIAVLSGATYYPLSTGILMTIAARGFVLWIINITFVIIIVMLALKVEELPEANLNTNSSNNMDTFGRINTPNKGFNNPAYNWNDERPTFNRNDSYSNPYSRGGPENLSKLPPISSTTERLAKIGRQGAKSPPQNVAPPKIPKSYIYPTQPRVPSPDYSPPNSPLQTQLKPALKRNQNAYGGYSGGRY